MLAQSRLLEHVLQRLLAPAPTRLGLRAERHHEVARLVANLALPAPHLVDDRLQPLILSAAILLDRLDLFLLPREQFLDRTDELDELGLAFLVCLLEPRPGLLEETRFRLGEQLVGRLAKLVELLFLGFFQILHAALEIGLLDPQRVQFLADRPQLAPRAVAFLAHAVELHPQIFRLRLGLARALAAEQPAEASPGDERDDGDGDERQVHVSPE